mmetsp:Transcript_45248/g.115056  ORF Transcript_45248/g.115056 Transcript_45248/m.115056 type:complete len:299 (-) Transcript_45248:201-1097(-)
MEAHAPAAKGLDLLPRRGLKGVRIDGQVLHCELVLIITLHPDLGVLVVFPDRDATHEQVLIVDLIPVIARIQVLQVNPGVGVDLHHSLVLGQKLRGDDVQRCATTLVARVDVTPAPGLGTLLTITTTAAIVSVLAAAAANLLLVAARGFYEVFKCEFEVVDVMAEELLAAAAALSAWPIEDLACRSVVLGLARDPPHLIAHAHAGSTVPVGVVVRHGCPLHGHHSDRGRCCRGTHEAAAAAPEGIDGASPCATATASTPFSERAATEDQSSSSCGTAEGSERGRRGLRTRSDRADTDL